MTAEIGEAGTDLGPMRVPDLISAARDSAAQLAAAEALVVRLETYPEPVIAYAVARASARQAADGLIERIDQAMMRRPRGQGAARRSTACGCGDAAV